MLTYNKSISKVYQNFNDHIFSPHYQLNFFSVFFLNFLVQDTGRPISSSHPYHNYVLTLRYSHQLAGLPMACFADEGRREYFCTKPTLTRIDHRSLSAVDHLFFYQFKLSFSISIHFFRHNQTNIKNLNL